MKIKLLLTTIFCFLIVSQSLAQTNILKRKINYTAREEKLEEVLLGIAYAGSFNFSYNPDLIPVDSLISLNVENSTVKVVLDKIFEDELYYKVSGNHLILLKEKFTKNKSQEKQEYTITGFIYDAMNGEGIKHATVFEINGYNSAITDDKGYYSLKVPGKFNEFGLSYSKFGFTDTLIIVKPADKKININLIPLMDERKKDSQKPGSFINHTRAIEVMPIVKSVVPEEQIVRSKNVDLAGVKPFQISLVPGISSNHKMSGSFENTISVNVLAGYSGGVRAFEVGGLVNTIRNDVNGVQAAGLVNIVGGHTKGVQIAGIGNNNRRWMVGAQIAGISNVILDSISGVQIAGVSNVLKGDMGGWQIAGISNVSTKNVDGVQISGVSNIAFGNVDVMQISGIVNGGKNVNGVQIGGIVNYAHENVGGMQISGVVNKAKNVGSGQVSGIANIATESVGGVQICGLLNYAKEVKGSQIGLININDTLSGVGIGLLNFSRKGYRRFEAYTSNIFRINASFKTGTHKFYNIFRAGLGRDDTYDVTKYYFGYGIGRASKPGKKFSLNGDLSVNWIHYGEVSEDWINILTNFDFWLSYSIKDRFSVFTGPTLNFYVSDWKEGDQFLSNLAPYTFFEKTKGDVLLQMWVHWNVGIRF